MSEQLLVSYVKQLAQDLEMEIAPSADTTKAYSFAFGKEINITLHAFEREGFYFHAFVEEAPITNLEDFYAFMMHANLFGVGTGHNVLGLDTSGKKVTLSQKCPFQLKYVEFKERVEDFVNYVDLWQKKTEDVKNKI